MLSALSSFAILGALSSQLVAAAFAENVFWIVSHAPLMASRLDPIVSPGGVSTHAHSVIGGSNFGPVYDYDTSIKSECTTANIGVDFSNYWIPQLMHKFANGSLAMQKLSYANTYYQMRRNGQEPVYEFPPGFRMLAGSPNRDSLDLNNREDQAISYVCLGGNTPEGHEFPKERCKDGLRAQVYFPHCWDGINNWLEGSKHVSYGAEGRADGGGRCPDTHPKRIMGLFYEFIFHDHYDYTPDARVWANGDTVGYSLHGDFTNGWPVGLFSEIFSYGKQCSVGFSLKDCPALAKHMSKDGGKCQYKGVMVDEKIGDDTLLTALPGNNPIWPAVRSANYVEKAQFLQGGQLVAPSPINVPSVKASEIKIGTVKGDAPYTIPPDPIAASTSVSATSTSASPPLISASTASSSKMDAPASAVSPSASKVSNSLSAGAPPASSTTATSLAAGNLAGMPSLSAAASSSSSSMASPAVSSSSASKAGAGVGAAAGAGNEKEETTMTMTATLTSTISVADPSQTPGSGMAPSRGPMAAPSAPSAPAALAPPALSAPAPSASASASRSASIADSAPAFDASASQPALKNNGSAAAGSNGNSLHHGGKGGHGKCSIKKQDRKRGEGRRDKIRTVKRKLARMAA